RLRLAGEAEVAEQALGGELRVVLALEPREQLEVLARREPSVLGRPLRRPADARALAPLDRPDAGLERAGEQRQERRLARAVRADERQRLAVPQLELDRLERAPVPEPAAGPARGEQRRRRGQRRAAAGGSSGGGSGAIGLVCSTSTSTGTASPCSHGSSVTRSPKNSQIAR